MIRTNRLSVRGAPSTRDTVAPSRSGYVRRPSSSHSVSSRSFAASGSQSVSTVRGQAAKAAPEEELELYEYGDPLAEFTVGDYIGPSPRDDTKHMRYLNPEDLADLRAVEFKAGRVMLSAITSMVSVNASNVLFLASGRGALLRDVAMMGPGSLTFVDIDFDTVTAAVNDVQEVGQQGLVALFPVCQDAWDFVDSCDEKYDLIVCVHSIGQVLKGSNRGSADDFITDVTRLLAPGGVLVADEHVGFTDVDGGAPGSLPDPIQRYVATGLGNFMDDVPYQLPRVVPGCTWRSEWITPGRPHPLQTWRYFAWEKRDTVDFSQGRVIEHLDYSDFKPLPVVGSVSGKQLFDVLYPRAARGKKLPISRDDARSVPPSHMMPKFDGTPAVVSFKDDVCLFVGAERGGTFRLPVMFDEPLMCIAEVCDTSLGDSVLIITGAVSIGKRHTDPMSESIMAKLRVVLKPLQQVGIIVNTPGLIAHVVGNRVSLPRAPNGRSIAVDGVNVRMGERWGKFMKPLSTMSIDVNPADWDRIKADVAGTAQAFRSFGDVGVPDLPLPPSGVVPAGVYEYGVRLVGMSAVIVPLRPRPDKTVSDGPGKVLVFMSAVKRATALGDPLGDTRNVVGYLNTG